MLPNRKKPAAAVTHATSTPKKEKTPAVLRGATKITSEGANARADRVRYFLRQGANGSMQCFVPRCTNACHEYMPFCGPCWKGRLTGKQRLDCWRLCRDNPLQPSPHPTREQQAWFSEVMRHVGGDPRTVGGPYVFKVMASAAPVAKQPPMTLREPLYRAHWCGACNGPFVYGHRELSGCLTRPVQGVNGVPLTEKNAEIIPLSELRNAYAYKWMIERYNEWNKRESSGFTYQQIYDNRGRSHLTG
jgi:hypothetical protein